MHMWNESNKSGERSISQPLEVKTPDFSVHPSTESHDYCLFLFCFFKWGMFVLMLGWRSSRKQLEIKRMKKCICGQSEIRSVPNRGDKACEAENETFQGCDSLMLWMFPILAKGFNTSWSFGVCLASLMLICASYKVLVPGSKPSLL